MKDATGLYYYPFPQNKRVRMYIRQAGDTIEFRLWHADDPTLWQQHGWVPHEAIKQAKSMFTGKHFDPEQAYDIRIAKVLIKEDQDEGRAP